MDYQPHSDEITSLLTGVAGLPGALEGLPGFAEVDAALIGQVLEEAGKFVAERIAPLNREGDETGARFAAGQVTMPPGFRDAYQAFWQAGWPALAAREEDGGQGLPAVLECVLACARILFCVQCLDDLLHLLGRFFVRHENRIRRVDDHQVVRVDKRHEPSGVRKCEIALRSHTDRLGAFAEL
jgi:hypothetical protein